MTDLDNLYNALRPAQLTHLSAAVEEHYRNLPPRLIQIDPELPLVDPSRLEIYKVEPEPKSPPAADTTPTR